MQPFPEISPLAKDRDKSWVKKWFDFAIDHYDSKEEERDEITQYFNEYNGETPSGKIKYLTNTYGKTSRTKFVDYRLGRQQINQLVGEFLQSPLNFHVKTTNSDALSKKQNMLAVQLGMMYTANEIKMLRNQGIDVFDGMEVPDRNDPEIQKKINPKDENEHIMQVILNDRVRSGNVKHELSRCWQHNILTSHAHGKIYINEDNESDFRCIDPRDAVYIEAPDDSYLERSPIKGERRLMYPYEIRRIWWDKFSDEDKNLFKELEENPEGSEHGQDDERKRTWWVEDDYENKMIETFTIQFKVPTKVYSKVITRKAGSTFKKEITQNFYEKNKKKIDKEVKKGKYLLEEKTEIVLWEATMIGDKIIVDWGPKNNQIKKIESNKAHFDYVNLLFNTINGRRISVQEIIGDISFLYNVVMYQINRELAKSKGKVVHYDLAGLPKGKGLEDIAHHITEDGLYVTNSAAEGNRYGREMTALNALKEIDLGMSKSVEVLVGLKNDLERSIMILTGMNPERSGKIRASSTVSNAQSSILSSRAMTEQLFFFFDGFVNRVMNKLSEKEKIIIGHIDPSRGERLLGHKANIWFKINEDFPFSDYNTYIVSSRKEAEAMKEIIDLGSVSLNNREIRAEDMLGVMMAETVIEAKRHLKQGWKAVKEIEQKQLEAKLKAGEKEQQEKRMIDKEKREDEQKHDKDMEILQSYLEGQNITLEQMQQAIGKKIEEREKAKYGETNGNPDMAASVLPGAQ